MCWTVYMCSFQIPYHKYNKKLSYRLENRASASCYRLTLITLCGIWLFLSFVIRHVWDFF